MVSLPFHPRKCIPEILTSYRAVSGISEAMHEELKPFNISVTVIEPGYFRTGFLNPGAQISSALRIDAYDSSTVGHVRDVLKKTDNNQPGDVVKGSKVIVDILTRSGVAEGREVPIRVALGSDSSPYIRAKMRRTEELLDAWDGVTKSTDHE